MDVSAFQKKEAEKQPQVMREENAKAGQYRCWHTSNESF